MTKTVRTQFDPFIHDFKVKISIETCKVTIPTLLRHSFWKCPTKDDLIDLPKTTDRLIQFFDTILWHPIGLTFSRIFSRIDFQICHLWICSRKWFTNDSSLCLQMCIVLSTVQFIGSHWHDNKQNIEKHKMHANRLWNIKTTSLGNENGIFWIKIEKNGNLLRFKNSCW